MEWTARFEPDGTLVTILASGTAKAEGIIAYLDGVLSDPAWRPGTPVLVDFRKLRGGHLTYAEVESMVHLHAPYLTSIGKGPIAVVVSRPVDFGMVRMWQSLAEDMFPVHEVFYSEEDALKWLRSNPESSAKKAATPE